MTPSVPHGGTVHRTRQFIHNDNWLDKSTPPLFNGGSVSTISLSATIVRLIHSSGTKLYQCADMLSDEDFFCQPKQGASAAWTMAHIVNTQDYFVSRMLNEKRRFEEFEDVFRGGRPLTADELRSFPERSTIVEKYRRSLERTVLSAQSFDESRWDDAFVSVEVGDSAHRTCGTVWEFLATHTFWHLGQLSATLKPLGGPAPLMYPNITLPS